MDVFDLADNLRAEFQEKGVSNEEFLLKIAETYDIKRVFVSSVADELFDKIPDKRIAEVPEVGMDEAKHVVCVWHWENPFARSRAGAFQF